MKPAEGEARSDTASDAASLAALIKRLEERLDAAEKTNSAIVERLEKTNTMRLAGSGRDRLKAMTDGEQRSVRDTKDLRDPTATTRMGFKDDDIVRLAATSERATRIRLYLEKSGELEAGKPLPLGIVTGYMYTNRRGERKYKVDFPGIGEDGIPESELELA